MFEAFYFQSAFCGFFLPEMRGAGAFLKHFRCTPGVQKVFMGTLWGIPGAQKIPWGTPEKP